MIRKAWREKRKKNYSKTSLKGMCISSECLLFPSSSWYILIRRGQKTNKRKKCKNFKQETILSTPTRHQGIIFDLQKRKKRNKLHIFLCTTSCFPGNVFSKTLYLLALHFILHRFLPDMYIYGKYVFNTMHTQIGFVYQKLKTGLIHSSVHSGVHLSWSGSQWNLGLSQEQ